MRIERLSFLVDSVHAVPVGWRLEGEPGYHRRNWARPGDRFDRAGRGNGGPERVVDLVVVELRESYAVVRGSGGEQLGPDDIVSGERLTQDDDSAGPEPDRRDAVRRLAGILGLPPSVAAAGADWAPAETALGVTLPEDYKRFVDAYGPGAVDEHITVCAPAAPHDWADLIEPATT